MGVKPKTGGCGFGGWVEAIDAIDAIDTIEAIVAVGFGGCGLGGMEEIKKSASRKKTVAVGVGVG